MKPENKWRTIEKQDLAMIARVFAGQKTTVDKVQKFGGWGYNRSANLIEMAVDLGFAVRLEEPSAVVFKEEVKSFPHQERLPLISVKEDPPQIGQDVLAYRPTRKIGNGYEIVEWQDGDEDVYSAWFPLVRPVASEDH